MCAPAALSLSISSPSILSTLRPLGNERCVFMPRRTSSSQIFLALTRSRLKMSSTISISRAPYLPVRSSSSSSTFSALRRRIFFPKMLWQYTQPNGQPREVNSGRMRSERRKGFWECLVQVLK